MKISRSQVATNVPTHKLPACWEYTNVSNVAALQPGYAFKSTWFTDEGVRLLRGTNIVPGGTRWEDVVRIPLSRVSEFSEYDLNVGDIVIAMDRPVISTGLKVTVLNLDDIPSLLLQRVGRFRLMGAIESKFLFAFLNGQAFLEHTGVLATGTQLPHISKSDIESAQIPIPPLNEQGRIVTAIESLQQRSAKARTLLTEVEPLIDKLRQSILQSAFSGRLTADWRAENPDVEPADQLLARIRVERRQRWEEAEIAKFEAKGKTPTKGWRDKYKDPEPVDETGLPELPEGWCWARFEEVANIDSKLVSPSDHFNSPHIAPDNIEKKTGKLLAYGTVSEDNVKSNKNQFFAGQIIYSKIRPYLSKVIVADFDGLCSADMYPISTKLNTNYLYRFMLSNFFLTTVHNEAGNRVVLPKINQQQLNNIPIPISPLDEQNQIETVLSDAVERLSDTSDIVRQAQLLANQLDQSILNRAFRGELVPQDPNDEPASELLARIQAAREAETLAKKVSKKKATRKKKKASP